MIYKYTYKDKDTGEIINTNTPIFNKHYILISSIIQKNDGQKLYNIGKNIRFSR